MRQKQKSQLLAAAAAMGAATGAAHADNVNGAWTPVLDWPLVAIHATLTPDGQVLTYGTSAGGASQEGVIYDVWYPSFGTGAQSHVTLPNGTSVDIFCSTSLIMPADQTVFIVGGDQFGAGNISNQSTTTYSPIDQSLAKGADLLRERWYANATTLPNGDIYIQGGRGGQDFPELRTRDGQRELLAGAPTGDLGWWYPRNFVRSGGDIFGFDGGGKTYTVNTSVGGSLAKMEQIPAPGNSGTSVMYRQDKIAYLRPNGDAYTVDASGPVPKLEEIGGSVGARHWVNGTILPTGELLFTGGSAVANTLEGEENRAEIYDPITKNWRLGAEGELARLYHSVALLLPDGRVLVAGGGKPGPLLNSNAEIYSPPYLFDQNANNISRPKIRLAGSVVRPGGRLSVQVDNPDQIERLTLVKTGSVTHSFNNEQRFFELVFERDGANFIARMPESAGSLTPGNYMLFAIDKAGTPSEAHMVRALIETNPDATMSKVLGEYGRLDLDHEWATVDLDHSFNRPVIVAYTTTTNGYQMVSTRIRNVRSNSFEIRLQEPSNLDNWHVLEDVAYLVLEQGAYTLDSGRRIEAGNTLTNKVYQSTRVDGYEQPRFQSRFATKPAVFSSVVDQRGGPHFVLSRQWGVTQQGFNVALTEEEGDVGGHLMEAIHWIAVEDAEGGDLSVKRTRTNHSPVGFVAGEYDLAAVQSVYGRDPAVLRSYQWGGVRLQEDSTRDRETWHVWEDVAALDLPGEEGFLRGR